MEAATTPVGCRVMTSLAKEGPERKQQGCFRPKTSTISSDIILPVPTSSPLLTDMMGTSGGSTSCSKHYVVWRGVCSKAAVARVCLMPLLSHVHTLHVGMYVPQ